jgi:hypothetical protein
MSNRYYEGGSAYAANSHIRSVSKYDTLGSKQSNQEGFDGIPLQHSLNKDTHVTTKVTAASSTTVETEDAASDAVSEDSILAVEGPRLGITKTTVTKVSYANKKNDMEPERQVEYKI